MAQRKKVIDCWYYLVNLALKKTFSFDVEKQRRLEKTKINRRTDGRKKEVRSCKADTNQCSSASRRFMRNGFVCFLRFWVLFASKPLSLLLSRSLSLSLTQRDKQRLCVKWKLRKINFKLKKIIKSLFWLTFRSPCQYRSLLDQVHGKQFNNWRGRETMKKKTSVVSFGYILCVT